MKLLLLIVGALAGGVLTLRHSPEHRQDRRLRAARGQALDDAIGRIRRKARVYHHPGRCVR